MAFLDKTGLQNLTNKLVQGDAIKVASHRGKNVKEVIDNIQRECENVALPNTMTLENRISKFKVGQGRDVDVSGDVEEGKIEVELQGKTWQNLVEYIADYEGYEKNGFYYSKNASRKLSFGLKPNTVYTRILDVKECFEPFWMYDSINNSDGTYRQYSYRIKQGLVINKFTSSDLGTINSYTFNPDQNVTNKENFNIVIGRMILLEGDYTQTPVEELPKYFSGIKSSFEDGIVDVEVQGKNLFDNSKIRDHSLISFDGEYVTCVSDGKGYRVFNNTDSAKLLKPNKTYYISVNVIENTLDSTFEVQFGVGEGRIENAMPKLHSYIDSKFTGVKKTTGVTQSDLKGKNILDCRMVSNSKSGYIRFKIMITEVENEKFEPYYKKKISFNIGEPLRSLPNGVCDEIRNNNGQWELVRRVGKIVLDGTTSYSETSSDSSLSNTMRFIFYPQILRKSGVENLYCDKFAVRNVYALDEEGVLGSAGGNAMYIRLLKSKLETQDIAGFKKWLKVNPTTIYYELETPIITLIEPIEFDVKPLATMIINSEIAPISKHKVVLNRAGQIEQGIQLIADLRNRINTLESIYDSNLIATQYKLDNLKLNYELEREED